MMVRLDELRVKLKKKILASASQEAVRFVIDDMLRDLRKHGVPANTYSGFIEKMMYDLDLYDPGKRTVRQQTHIKIARIHFLQTQLKLKFKARINQ